MPSLVVSAASLLLDRAGPATPCLPTGIASLDALVDGLPRGAISELSGLRSSGKTSLLMSTLAQATSRGEVCAWVDTSDRFDPASAARAGVVLDNLLWTRCHQDAAAALRVVDLLLHGGGFGMVCLDLSDVPPRVLNRLPSSYWYRFRRVIENTPAILVILSEHPHARSCALRSIECRQSGVVWSGPENARLLEGLRSEAVPRKPMRAAAAFSVSAL